MNLTRSLYYFIATIVEVAKSSAEADDGSVLRLSESTHLLRGSGSNDEKETGPKRMLEAGTERLLQLIEINLECDDDDKASDDDDISSSVDILSPSPSPSPTLSSTSDETIVVDTQTRYAIVEVGTCQSNGMLPIYDSNACIDAATSLGYTIEWGPHGGYEDVIDGCSIRFNTDLFLTSQEGTCDPDANMDAWQYTGCQCTDWMPCFCETEVSYQHIPNAYCKYYETGGTEDCATGDSFAYAWTKCIDDGSDKCMGVMWNSCEGPTSDTSVSGAWKLMTAGQDVGDANNPTDTCGDALGHWDVFLVLMIEFIGQN